jgi:hypothetical protein
MVEIGGSELTVILAVTSLESRGIVVDDTEPDGEMEDKSDTPQKSSAKNKWSSKMDSQLERLLCSTTSHSDSISISDFEKTSPSIKMTILKCMTDMEDVSDSDLFPSSKDGSQSYKVPIYIDDESDEDKAESDSVDGKIVKNLTNQFTTAQISPSSSPKPSAKSKVSGFPEKEYFRTFGKSVGYSEAEVEEGLMLCDNKTTPADFLNILNREQQKRESEKRDSAVGATMDVAQNNFPPPPNVPSSSSSVPINGRRSLPQEYKKKLVQDFTEETEDLSVEELKRRNVERQKVLKSAFEQEAGNTTETKSPQKKKRKKKKKKKSSDPVKIVGEGSKENPAMVCSSDDEEQTQVMTVWNEGQDQTSDSDDCMIVDETFPVPVPDPLMENNKSSNQPRSQVHSQPKHGHTDRSSRFNPPHSDHFQHKDSEKSRNEPWRVVQKSHQYIPRFDQPPRLGGPLPNPGDFQHLGRATNNLPLFRFDAPPPTLGLNKGMNRPNGPYAANPIPPPSVTAPILGAGSPPYNQQQNLRYVVIDGSNVAMW